jgi:hypothetical protein
VCNFNNSSLIARENSRLLDAVATGRRLLPENLNLKPGELYKPPDRVLKRGAARIDIMPAAIEEKWKQSKTIIVNACRMLLHAREVAPVFTWGLSRPNPDAYVLLGDASKMLCAAVSEHYGEPAGRRWSPTLPGFLLTHPEKCEETVALLEQKDLPEPSRFEYSAA